MISFEDVNVLGQLIQSSWGNSSTGSEKYRVPAGRSIKASILSGEEDISRLMVKFVTVVNLHGHETMLANPSHPGAKIVREESLSLTKDYISNLKKAFKEATGKTLSLKEDSSTDSIELINYNIFNPNRTVYYRRNSIFSIKA